MRYEESTESVVSYSYYYQNLHQIYTGKRPFHGQNDAWWTANVVHKQIRPDRSQVLSPMSETLYTVLTRCWRHHPQERLVIDDVVNQLNGGI